MDGKRIYKIFLFSLITVVIVSVRMPNNRSEKLFVKVSSKGEKNSYKCLKIVWGER